AGHVADRFHRGRIVAVCLVVQAGVALTLALATQGWGAAGPWTSRDLLLGLSVALGLARSFQMPAQQALTPMLVPAGLLPRAMAFSSAGMQAAVIGGPALGGVIFVAGATAVYATCTALFATGCALVMGVRYEHLPPPRAPVTLRAAPAAGALVVSVLLTRWPLQRRVGHVMLSAVALYGACMVVFGLSTSFALSLAVLALSGGADMVSVVVRQTLMQIETPDAMRGRVSAVNSVFIGASNQLGEFESGATAAWLGPVGSVLAGGIGTLLVAALWLKWFPALAGRDRMVDR
ncbi:MAG: MFS transporter, partial [Polaromonas sp. 35-63-240]